MIGPLATIVVGHARIAANMADAEAKQQADSEIAGTIIAAARASIVDSLESQLTETKETTRNALMASAIGAFNSQLESLQVTPRFSGNVIDLQAVRTQRQRDREEASQCA